MCKFTIPDAANDLFVEINIANSLLSIGMEINAPEDKSTIKGQVNWFLRQLQNKEAENSFVRIKWTRASEYSVKMNDLDGKNIFPPSSNSRIVSFTPLIQVSSTSMFNSRKKFISALEKNVRLFYDEHAQHLKQWVPKPPKPIDSKNTDDDISDS